MKETKHTYRGFDIIWSSYEKQGSQIFYTGYYRPNTIQRNYNIKKDGKFVINPSCIFERLKDAKEEIDRIIKKTENG